MRGSVGLVIGAVVGAGAMYLALRPPWGGHADSSVPRDAGPDIVAVHPDAGVAKKKKKAHRPAAQPGQPEDPGEDSPAEPQGIQLTSADRANEWRGDSNMALPPRKLDMAGGGEPRPLDDGEIHAGLAGGSGAIQQCVVAGATGTDLSASITVELVVDGSGKIIHSRINAPKYLQDHGLLDCARRAFGRMHFAAPGAATLVTLPVTLG